MSSFFASILLHSFFLWIQSIWVHKDVVDDDCMRWWYFFVFITDAFQFIGWWCNCYSHWYRDSLLDDLTDSATQKKDNNGTKGRRKEESISSIPKLVNSKFMFSPVVSDTVAYPLSIKRGGGRERRCVFELSSFLLLPFFLLLFSM